MCLRYPKHVLIAFVVLLISTLATQVKAQSWQSADAASARWSTKPHEIVRAYAESLNPTAVMVVQDGKIIANWGNVSRKVNVASVRKSLLSALYGIAVSEGRIRLDSTLAELGIDDKPPTLTNAEKQATVRDLLMARSGIYHPAAHETGDNHVIVVRGKLPVASRPYLAIHP
jgi:CubicO group peptidase (beta-lactamase class C family)